MQKRAEIAQPCKNINHFVQLGITGCDLQPEHRPTLQKHKPFCRIQVHGHEDAIVWDTWNRLQSLNRLEKQAICIKI